MYISHSALANHTANASRMRLKGLLHVRRAGSVPANDETSHGRIYQAPERDRNRDGAISSARCGAVYR